MPEIPPQKAPSWWDQLPLLIHTILANPVVTGVFAAAVFIAWAVVTQPPKLIEQIQKGYDRLEERHDKTDARREIVLEKLANAIERNTDAIRGKVFAPKTSDKSGKSPGPNGP